MAFQACVRHVPYASGNAVLYTFDSQRERAEFVKGADVWWYMFPESDDWEWSRGGAWSAQMSDIVIPWQRTEPEPEHGDDNDGERWLKARHGQ